MDLAVLLIALGTIFVVELPDKTFIATLVLSTRYPPLLVWIGVGLAFFVQTLIAVLAGSVAGLLPDDAVRIVSGSIFLLGAVLLLREARTHDGTTDEDEYAERAATPRSGLAVIGTSFVVLFAAEWGDLSQLLTISLVAKYDDPLSVFLGAWGALLLVSGLAILVGRALLQRIRLTTLYYAGATVCLGLATYTAYEILAS